MTKVKFTAKDFEKTEKWLKEMNWWIIVLSRNKNHTGWDIIADANMLWQASQGGKNKNIYIEKYLTR